MRFDTPLPQPTHPSHLKKLEGYLFLFPLLGRIIRFFPASPTNTNVDALTRFFNLTRLRHLWLWPPITTLPHGIELNFFQPPCLSWRFPSRQWARPRFHNSISSNSLSYGDAPTTHSLMARRLARLAVSMTDLDYELRSEANADCCPMLIHDEQRWHNMHRTHINLTVAAIMMKEIMFM